MRLLWLLVENLLERIGVAAQRPSRRPLKSRAREWQPEYTTVGRSGSFLGSSGICKSGWSQDLPKEEGDTLGEGRRPVVG